MDLKFICIKTLISIIKAYVDIKKNKNYNNFKYLDGLCLFSLSDPASIIFFRCEESGLALTIQFNQLSNASLFQQLKWLFFTTYNETQFARSQKYATTLT